MSRFCFAGFPVWMFALLLAMPALAQQPNPGRFLPRETQPAAQPPATNRYQSPPPQPGTGRIERRVQPVQQAPPQQAPIQLTPQQQAVVDQILALWETESDKITNFSCSFDRWEYDPVFGPGPDANGQDVAKTKSVGQLKYSKPDKGKFRVDQIKHYTPPRQPGVAPTWEAHPNDHGEHWVCDGEAVYQFDADKKQLIVRHLPPEMRGKAIADGPLPFLFGAKKDDLKRRYFIQLTRSTQTEIWLEAYPRFRQDAANFHHVQIILDREKFLPKALQVYLPDGKNRTVYIFGEATVNSSLENFLPTVFTRPRTPLGWKKVIEEPPTPQPARQAGVPAGNPSAR